MSLDELFRDSTAALFFVFRTRDLGRLRSLPRDSALQRLVLNRAAAGDPWQIGSGYIRLRLHLLAQWVTPDGWGYHA